MSVVVDWHHTPKKLTPKQEAKFTPEELAERNRCLYVMTDINDEIRRMDWSEVEQLASNNGKVVYVERGCPRRGLAGLLEADIKVGFVDGKEVNDAREVLGQLKSHEVDVKILKEGVEKGTFKVDFVGKEFIKNLSGKIMVGLYQDIVKHLVALKNKKKAAVRELLPLHAQITCDYIDSVIEADEKKKKEIQAQLAEQFAEEVKKLGIKGIAGTLVGQILTLAHPTLFSHPKQYQKYCGFRENCGNKYSRDLKTAFFWCVDQVIKFRSPVWRDKYDEIKAFRLNSPEVLAKYEALKDKKEKSKKSITVEEDGEEIKGTGKHFISFKSYVEKTTKNRVATLMCRYFYDTFH